MKLFNSLPIEITFFQVIDIPTYTDEEYENHLKIAKWSRGETDYLFDTCRRFDIRWPIVFDRYDCKMFGVNRAVEYLKERFYSINYELNLLRVSEFICETFFLNIS